MRIVLVPLLVAIALVTGCSTTRTSRITARDAFQDTFNVSKSDLISTGRNDYVILEPGYQHEYQSDDERFVITVLNETKKVDGVETRIVEEREWKGGKLAEVSRNFFAIDRHTKDVYYFGEEVDNYKNDQIADHHGTWLAGEKGARFGLFMPAKPQPGQKFYQEIAPGVAMDCAEIVGPAGPVETPAGKFDLTLKVKESTPLEKGTETKTYGMGVGLLNDGEMKLTRHGRVAK